MLGGVGAGHQAHGASAGPEKNAVDPAGGPGAGPPGGELPEHRPGFVVQPGTVGVLRPCRIDSILAEHELEISGGVRPEQVAVLGRSDHHDLALWSGKIDPIGIAFQIARGGIPGDVVLRPRIGPQGPQQIGVGVFPQEPAGQPVDPGEEFLGRITNDGVLIHADGASVEEGLIAVMPDRQFGFGVDGEQGPSESKGGVGIGEFVAFPDVPGPVAEPPALGLERLHLDFAVAHQGIENPLAQAHPFPDRSVGKAFGHLDFVADGAGDAVIDFARPGIAHVERILGGDHGVAVDHESLGEGMPPEDGAIPGIDAEQGVQHVVLVGLVGDVPEGFVKAPSRDDRLLGHGAEFRIGNELRAEPALRGGVGRLGIVVGPVERVRPFVIAGRHGLDGGPSVEMGHRPGMDDPQGLGFRQGLPEGGPRDQRVGHIVGEMKLRGGTGFRKNSAPQQVRLRRELAQRGDLGGLGRLEIDGQFRRPGQVQHGGGASLRQAHETDDALAHPEGLGQRGFGSSGWGRRQQDRAAGGQKIPGWDIHGKREEMGKF